MATTDYSFVRRPRWIAGHLIAAIAVVIFVLAGLWQLSRLDERRETNAVIGARALGPAIDLPAAPRTDAQGRNRTRHRAISANSFRHHART